VIPDSACIFRYGSNYCDVEVMQNCRSSIDRPDHFRNLRKYNLEYILTVGDQEF